MNVGRMNYFVCKADRTFWLYGSNMFSGWKRESELDWERIRYILSRSTEMAPAYLGWSDDKVVDAENCPF